MPQLRPGEAKKKKKKKPHTCTQQTSPQLRKKLRTLTAAATIYQALAREPVMQAWWCPSSPQSLVPWLAPEAPHQSRCTDITLVEGTGTQALTLYRKCFPTGRAVPKWWARGFPIPGDFQGKAAHFPRPLRDSDLWLFLKNRWAPPAKILQSSHLAWG